MDNDIGLNFGGIIIIGKVNPKADRPMARGISRDLEGEFMASNPSTTLGVLHLSNRYDLVLTSYSK
jgi:hypothetical protein